MAENLASPFSAANSMLGYLFQCRYALLECLRRVQNDQEFAVSLETLEDVVFSREGSILELLETKHHINKKVDLTDACSDLWKSIRIWCEAIRKGNLPDGSVFFLITTAQAPEGSAAHYLKVNGSRNEAKAIEKLSDIARSSTNQDNAPAYAVFQDLTIDQMRILASSAFVIDCVPSILDLDEALREELGLVVNKKFRSSFLQRLEGWWFQRVIKQLTKADPRPVLSTEFEAVIISLQEQFKQESLPIDEEVMSRIVDASGYQNAVFVSQLRWIGINDSRIIRAIQNFFRAKEHKSRWISEHLMPFEEWDHYETILHEEWDIRYQIMLDNLAKEFDEEKKKGSGRMLYEWAESGLHQPIRPGVSTPNIARGTYHILADNKKIGWHPEFDEKLKQLISP